MFPRILNDRVINNGEKEKSAKRANKNKKKRLFETRGRFTSLIQYLDLFLQRCCNNRVYRKYASNDTYAYRLIIVAFLSTIAIT